MSDLAIVTCVLGSGIVVLNLPAVLAPSKYRKGIIAFPRSRWAAWILTAVALTWTASIVLHAPLGRFEHFKPAVYVVAPVGFLLISALLDELLAARALGGLLLLLGNPLLNIARWHESPLRLVLTVLVYLWVVFGIMLVLSPYRFRQATAPWVENNLRCRLAGCVGLLIGGLLLFLGSQIY